MRSSPVVLFRRAQAAFAATPPRQRAPLFVGLAMTCLLTFMIIFAATAAPFPTHSTTIGSSATGPASSGANAAKRTLAMNDIDDINHLTNRRTTAAGDRFAGLAARAERVLLPGNVGAALRSTNAHTQSSRNADGELVSLQIVHRHGARTPIHPAPLQTSQWTPLSLGLGHLTIRGRAQHEAFGRKLRATYIPNSNSFLPTSAPGSDIVYVRSTDVDRCLISAQSLLQGLWPGSRIPIHTILEDTEALLQPSDKCPAYKSNHPAVINRWSRRAIQEIPHILEKLKTITGFSLIGDNGTKDKTTIEVRAGNLISHAVDNTACALTQGLPLDQYFSADIIATLTNFTKQMYFEQYGMNYSGTTDDTIDSRGPSGAQLIQLLRQNFEDKTTSLAPNSPPLRRLSIFSAHDTTLIALASSLGLLRSVNDHLLPPFAASMIFELRRKKDVHGDYDYYINMLYGQPKPTSDTADLDTADGWEYQIEPMPINCQTATSSAPTLSKQCLFNDWSDYVHRTNPTPTPTQGCCIRSSGFYEFGCDNYTKPYTELPSECRMYRRICPISSCASNQVMNTATMTCSDVGRVDASGSSSMKSFGLGFMAAGALLFIIAVFARLRNNKVPSVRSLDGSVQYAPVLTLRR